MQKKFHRRCLPGLRIAFRLRVWNIEFTLVPSPQIKPRKYSAGKFVCVTSFLKKRKVFMQKQLSKGFFKKSVFEISQNSQQSISVGIFFLIKLNSVDLQLHEKRDSSAGVFLWILQIRKNTFFSKHHQTDGSNCSSISSISNEGRIGKQNCKLWSKNHVPIWARRVTYWEGYSRWKNRFQEQSCVDFSF